MSKFRNLDTGVVVSVAAEKDARFTAGWVDADAPESEPKRAPGRPKKSEN